MNFKIGQVEFTVIVMKNLSKLEGILRIQFPLRDNVVEVMINRHNDRMDETKIEIRMSDGIPF